LDNVKVSFELSDGTDVAVQLPAVLSRSLSLYSIFVEIKPLLGDDYPKILRDIKSRRLSFLRSNERLSEGEYLYVLFAKEINISTSLADLYNLFRNEKILLIKPDEISSSPQSKVYRSHNSLYLENLTAEQMSYITSYLKKL